MERTRWADFAEAAAPAESRGHANTLSHAGVSASASAGHQSHHMSPFIQQAHTHSITLRHAAQWVEMGGHGPVSAFQIAYRASGGVRQKRCSALSGEVRFAEAPIHWIAIPITWHEIDSRRSGVRRKLNCNPWGEKTNCKFAIKNKRELHKNNWFVMKINQDFVRRRIPRKNKAPRDSENSREILFQRGESFQRKYLIGKDIFHWLT